MTEGPRTRRTSVLARLKQDLFPDGCFVIQGPFAAKLWRATDEFPVFGVCGAKHKYIGARGFAEGTVTIMCAVQRPSHRSARGHGRVIASNEMLHLEFGLWKTGAQPIQN